MGCAAAQGWYFSRPLNAASATAWLAEREAPAIAAPRERKPAAVYQVGGLPPGQ
jgi:hypothetical protein